MLTLPIKKQWFDMIRSGEKKEEYRELTKYYSSRFYGIQMGFIEPIILLRNGYSSNSPTIKCKVDISTGVGNPDWGQNLIKNILFLRY